MVKCKVTLSNRGTSHSTCFDFESEDLGILYAKSCIAPEVDVVLSTVDDEGAEHVVFQHDSKAPVHTDDAVFEAESAPIPLVDEVEEEEEKPKKKGK